jgi:predicted transcriptional regulator
MPLSKEVETRQKILKELSKTNKGLTINDLAKHCDVSRYTISKVLQRLIGEGKIEVREIGPAKLHYLK